MVKEYLERYRDSLLEEKISLENEYKKLGQRLEENGEFCDLLERKNDPNFEAFTPHVIHSKDKEKIKELQAEQQEMAEKQNDLKKQIANLEKMLAELSGVILSALQSEEESKTLRDQIRQRRQDSLRLIDYAIKENNSVADWMQDDMLWKIEGILNKLEFCSDLAEVDASRCKLEINALSETVQTVRDEFIEMKQRISFPEISDASDLSSLISDELKKMETNENCKTTVNTNGEPWPLSSAAKKTILYLMQLWIREINDDTEISEITVQLNYAEEVFSLELLIDGKENKFCVPKKEICFT